MVDSDKHWARLGRIDPYLKTVRTLDPYKLDPNMPVKGEARYFASGERYVTDLFETIERSVCSGFKPKTAVDFGCSVGRIAIPLAKRCELVIGLDVSPDALAEAERNASRFGVTNTRWLPSDDQLTRMADRVDLFHSYNVLQHLPVARGLSIVRIALARLAPGGVIAVHVPYADRASPVRRAINWAQAHIPGIHLIANITRGRPYDYPHMLMNSYDLTTLISLLCEGGCAGVHCKFINQGRYPGVLVIARTGTDVPAAPAVPE
jgi:2-polyprenyl-3-methyl-5-hydroxy-6-metoxy-1,4-benzoquinol methylase